MKQGLKYIPYGVMSYEILRRQGFAYVDKTPFIKVLEESDTFFPFVARPRCFGKSIFADMLMIYYDKAAAKDFNENFAGTWIGEHVTPFASKYLVLKFDFSGAGGGENLVASLAESVKRGIRNFSNRYLRGDVRIQNILDASYASLSALLMDFLDVVESRLDEKIYLIVDEYDRFACDILFDDIEGFHSLAGKDGSIRNFYSSIKDATQTSIERMFISGVMPVSLDSMTSGFNIAKNRTTFSDFAAMAGFTDGELRNLIPQVVNLERYGHSIDDVVERMKFLYGGYRFSPDSEAVVCNSSMCLYYLKAIAETNHEPEDLVEPSFSADLSKMGRILSLGSKVFAESIVQDVLSDRLIESPGISRTININAPEGLAKRDVLTALVCMGFLTFSASDRGCLVCPNQTVKDLFFRY